MSRLDGTTYACPKCGQAVVVYVPLAAPPTCSKHTGGGVLMQARTTGK